MDTLPSSSSGPTIRQVVIAHLCRSSDFQVRRKLCLQTVNRYAAAIKAGQELPSLQVALVDGVPCLVDGYHRAAALESLGVGTAEATVSKTSREDAQWMAAQANLTHGLPLKRSEIRAVFRVYIRAGKHRKGRGRLKSYREIGLELGRPHTTIRNWMEKDFRKIFNEYGGQSCAADGGCQPLLMRTSLAAEAAINHLKSARQAFQEASCNSTRETIRNYLIQLTTDLAGSSWQMSPSDF